MKERISVTVDVGLHAKVKRLAREQGRNVSNMVSLILTEATKKLSKTEDECKRE